MFRSYQHVTLQPLFPCLRAETHVPSLNPQRGPPHPRTPVGLTGKGGHDIAHSLVQRSMPSFPNHTAVKLIDTHT